MTAEGVLGVSGEIMNDAKSGSGVDDLVVALIIFLLVMVIGVEVRRVAIDWASRVEIRFETKDELSARKRDRQRERERQRDRERERQRETEREKERETHEEEGRRVTRTSRSHMAELVKT
jgi:Ni/Co efflux regulator RcnB